MKTGILRALVLGAFCCLHTLRAGQESDVFPPLLYAAEGAGKILQFDTCGNIVWEYPAEMARDVWSLPDGRVLFCFNREYDGRKHDNPSGVMEVTRDKAVVFSFTTTGQVWSCQRLKDGNTLVGAASQGKLLIVTPAGAVLRSITLVSPPGHSCLRNARQLASGHFLVAEESAQAVREYGAEGGLVREFKVPFCPYSAVRLANGNTMICGQQTLLELDPAGKVMWTVAGAELPELGVRWFAGIQVLPKGGILVCNAGGKVPFFELASGGKVTWRSPASMSTPLGHGIQRLDVPGSPDR